MDSGTKLNYMSLEINVSLFYSAVEENQDLGVVKYLRSLRLRPFTRCGTLFGVFTATGLTTGASGLLAGSDFSSCGFG